MHRNEIIGDLIIQVCQYVMQESYKIFYFFQIVIRKR
jgi:hypothetical protein